MKKDKSKKTVAKRVTSLPRHTAPHSAQQHDNPLTGRVGPTSVTAKASPNRKTKREKVLAMLRSNRGATIEAIVKATGWQQHSVRGFLTGVVRKRLKLDLTSEKPGKDRIYRIKAARSSAAKATATGSMA